MTKGKFKKYIIGFWTIIIMVILGVTLFFSAISWGWFGEMPTFEELENPQSNLASEIYSADQVLLGKYYIENRSKTHYSKLSPHLVHALLATEDIRFRDHAGIDLNRKPQRRWEHHHTATCQKPFSARPVPFYKGTRHAEIQRVDYGC